MKRIIVAVCLLVVGENGPLLGQTSPTPVPPTAFDKYKALMDQAVKDRGNDANVGRTDPVISGNETVETGDTRTTFQQYSQKVTQRLGALVMMDNTIGVVYPGALLWAAPIRDTRLQAIEVIPKRPPVIVTFTGLRSSFDRLPAAETLIVPTVPKNVIPLGSGNSKPAKPLKPFTYLQTNISSPDPSPTGHFTVNEPTIAPVDSKVSFTYNGTYSDFQAKAEPIFKATESTSTRVKIDFRISKTIEEALLDIGLSAKYWVVSMSAGLNQIRKSSRSVAIMTIDQTYYSASADAPPLGGYLPDSLVKADPKVAQRLYQLSLEGGGEPVYVRKVDYGRRVMIALSAEANEEQFRAALNVAVSAVSASGNFNFDDQTKKLWSSVEGKFISIGGKIPDNVGALFGGDIQAFVEAAKAILKPENMEVSKKFGPVPVSFELAYARDNAPMQVFETAEFGGKIQVRTQGRQTRKIPITTGPGDAAVVREDAEVDHDDWTLVTINSQALSVAGDGKTVVYKITWSTEEGSGDRHAPDETKIVNSKTFVLSPEPGKVELISPDSFGARDLWYGSNNGGSPQAFPDCGLLSNIRIAFDGDGDDIVHQQLSADLTYDIWVDR